MSNLLCVAAPRSITATAQPALVKFPQPSDEFRAGHRPKTGKKKKHHLRTSSWPPAVALWVKAVTNPCGTPAIWQHKRSDVRQYPCLHLGPPSLACGACGTGRPGHTAPHTPPHSQVTSATVAPAHFSASAGSRLPTQRRHTRTPDGYTMASPCLPRLLQPRNLHVY